MRVLVCGSRAWEDETLIHVRLAALALEHGEDNITVVHGAARGADTLAEQAARRLGLCSEAHPANWSLHGRSAGLVRNIVMIDSGVDLVLAFHRNQSRGTQHTISQARQRGIPVEVITEGVKHDVAN